ncbi:hypothetical protein K440DRAFT_468972, partial [Wilcoxina mikolae CBS 423.85]
MPLNYAIQLSLELATVFPIRTAVEAAGAQIIQLARDLRKSGSDLVVEEDLAQIFGRGRIGQHLEVAFKDAGIMKTLAACSSQTSAFKWSFFVRKVEAKLRQSMPEYHHSPDYLRLSPSLLLGAMDCLYLVQSLPDDRKITVSNEMGCITLIIWAHYILELTV